jgi:hypothetical protein
MAPDRSRARRRRIALVLLTALLTTRAAGDEAVLPPCLEPYDGHFLALREVVVCDALSHVPAGVAHLAIMTISQYVRALDDERTPSHIGAELSSGLVVRCAQHWLMITSYCTYVRRDAVSLIDERPGSLHLSPATPAIPGGAGALAQPDAIGVTVSVGSGRIFAGVRTQARSLAITHADVCALAALVQAPSAAMVLRAVEASP